MAPFSQNLLDNLRVQKLGQILPDESESLSCPSGFGHCVGYAVALGRQLNMPERWEHLEQLLIRRKSDLISRARHAIGFSLADGGRREVFGGVLFIQLPDSH
jgi:hypothetical protein